MKEFMIKIENMRTMPPAPSTWSLKDFSRLATTTSSQSPSIMTAVADFRRPRILRSLFHQMAATYVTVVVTDYCSEKTFLLAMTL